MNDEYVLKLIELNKKNIELNNSKECVFGRKFFIYFNFLKKFKFISLIKQFHHDIHADKKSSRALVDFDANKYIVKEEKIVVYSAIYGSYDEILEPLSVDENCDYYLFTDQSIPEGSVWKKADDSLLPSFCNTPTLKNRYIKMFPNKFFSNRFTIYIDGNLQIVANPSWLIQKDFVDCKTGIAMHLHPRGYCIYKEAKNAYFKGKISKKNMKYCLKFYKHNGMPKNYGMFECNVIARDSYNKNCISLMNSWWDAFYNGIKRDQLYFTFILYKNGYVFDDVFCYGKSVNDNYLFIRKEHK